MPAERDFLTTFRFLWKISLLQTLPAPYDLYLQALIGLDPDSLSNLFVLEVR